MQVPRPTDHPTQRAVLRPARSVHFAAVLGAVVAVQVAIIGAFVLLVFDAPI